MIRVLSLFSGIGAFEKALERQGIEHEIVAYCEIDKYASKSYSAIHNTPESKNLGDITKIDTDKLPDFDLMTWGFPCQDISVAGNLKGIVGGETRSGLYYEGFRILKAKMPKYSIIENVKNLVGKRFRADFEQMLSDIDSLGYNNYWQVLNAKDYGIPQNRERVFIVSIRKDVDKGGFAFPTKEPLELRLKDTLETEVDEKYYLSKSMLEYALDLNEAQNGTKWAGRVDSGKLNPNIAYSVTCRGAGGSQRAGVSNFIYDGIDGEISISEYKRNIAVVNNLRIRKLTPKECWRLMGFDDADFHKARDAGMSNTQLYKQAGNSIVVDVLEAIFIQLLKGGSNE